MEQSQKGDTMTDFLNFLNTANLDQLTNIPGVTRPIAGNIIAARPFNSVDDCLKIKGVSKSLLTRMQSFAEAQENESENRAMIPAEEEALPAPVEQNQPAQEYVKDQPSFFTRLGRAIVNFIRALFRLIAI
ncbi:MAG: helix-hairpin-helix domain-containing protein, partial [Anaerolineales bacterium]|nr:helix-hairpin-helix domain-containing protein [Anaerolineales bacterium]